MSEQENIAVVRRYFREVWNKGNYDAADEIVSPTFSVEGCGGAISGLDAVKLYISSYRSVYPNVHFTMLSIVAERDKVVACWVGTGMQSACEGSAHKATYGLSVYRIANGRIMEAWSGSDHSGIMQRMGIQREGNRDTT